MLKIFIGFLIGLGIGVIIKNNEKKKFKIINKNFNDLLGTQNIMLKSKDNEIKILKNKLGEA